MLLLSAAGLGVVALTVLGVVLVLGKTDPPSPEAQQRPAALRTAVGEPVPPTGAVLRSRHEYPGDDNSDGPEIDRRYRFSGTSQQAVDYYRTSLAGDGWQEEQAGNSPGQLANFGRSLNGQRVSIVIFDSRGGFALSAFG